MRTATLTYDEYGNPGAGNVGAYQYTGQMWLADAGLYHYKNRAYHPGLGRFLQTDPIGVTGGINLYAYVGNDAVNAVDPLGLSSIELTYLREADIRTDFTRSIFGFSTDDFRDPTSGLPGWMEPGLEDGCPFDYRCNSFEFDAWMRSVESLIFFTQSLGFSWHDALYVTGWYSRFGCGANGEPAGYAPVGDRGQYMRGPDGQLYLTPNWHATIAESRESVQEGAWYLSGTSGGIALINGPNPIGIIAGIVAFSSGLLGAPDSVIRPTPAPPACGDG